jgi:hypothetical protein
MSASLSKSSNDLLTKEDREFLQTKISSDQELREFVTKKVASTEEIEFLRSNRLSVWAVLSGKVPQRLVQEVATKVTSRWDQRIGFQGWY